MTSVWVADYADIRPLCPEALEEKSKKKPLKCYEAQVQASQRININNCCVSYAIKWAKNRVLSSNLALRYRNNNIIIEYLWTNDMGIII